MVSCRVVLFVPNELFPDLPGGAPTIERSIVRTVTGP